MQFQEFTCENRGRHVGSENSSNNAQFHFQIFKIQKKTKGEINIKCKIHEKEFRFTF